MEKKYKEKLEKIFSNYWDRVVNLKKLASLDKNYQFDVNEVNESLDDSISYLKDEMLSDLENTIDEMKRCLDNMLEHIDAIVNEKKVRE